MALCRVLSLRAAAADDVPGLAGWKTRRGTARWLGETGTGWHAHALGDPDQDHFTTLMHRQPPNSQYSPRHQNGAVAEADGTRSDLVMMTHAPSHP